MVSGEERAVGCAAKRLSRAGAKRRDESKEELGGRRGARTGGPGREQARKLVQALAPHSTYPLNITL